MLNLQSIYFGQDHKNFDSNDYDLIRKISRLAHKHHRQCENDCNGEGFVNGKFYRCDGSTPGAYMADNETTIFVKEINTIENRINKLIDKNDVHPIIKGWKVEFQHDPRGATVKLYYEDSYIEL